MCVYVCVCASLCVISQLSLVLILRLTPGLMLEEKEEEEEAAVTVTVYSVPGLTSTTSACEYSQTQTPRNNLTHQSISETNLSQLLPTNQQREFLNL